MPVPFFPVLYFFLPERVLKSGKGLLLRQMENDRRKLKMTSITSAILAIIIAGYLAYIIYDEGVTYFLKGRNILTVRLRKRNLVDQLIFFALIIILFISNRLQGNSATVNILLLILAAAVLFSVLIHSPKARFKEKGFIYGFQFIKYDEIKKMRLSKDGVLVIDTDRRRVLLFARKIEDLEHILNVFTEK